MASTKSAAFTAEERDAMKSYAAERRAANGRKGGDKAAADAQDLVEAIEKMTPEDAALAKRVSDIVTQVAPDLAPKTWYGMPAWSKEGKTLLFFKNAAKFKERYSTLGFTDLAALDEGDMWPKEFAIAAIGDAEAERIADLVRRAAG